MVFILCVVVHFVYVLLFRIVLCFGFIICFCWLYSHFDSLLVSSILMVPWYFRFLCCICCYT